jgi:hypothetical protein
MNAHHCCVIETDWLSKSLVRSRAICPTASAISLGPAHGSFQAVNSTALLTLACVAAAIRRVSRDEL